ncbi:glutaminase A [Limoniibacter endophyticus]|uniref:Glutaminase n=1 Tax=Limoniibacter endophyticus TaxID=1565040 RepID=A0A8J3DK74_9HYPH|nr:glutaminase A [Limoniibacter endophyticus]GHC75518.1 glutaminase [Limoniibacter endophyticus]
MADPLQDENELRKLVEDVAQRVRKAAPRLYDEAVSAAAEKEQAPPRKGDFERFGIAVETKEGIIVSSGNAGVNFPIQSISKVFALEVALEAVGEPLWRRLGREPSGDPFNSIIDLERAKGIPRNPFINAGALVICDVLVGLGGKRSDRHVEEFISRQLQVDKIELDDSVMESGRKGGELNRSLMFMASHFGNLKHDIERVMDAYVRQCAISLDCRGLARAGRFLMHDDDGDEERSVRAAQRARRILSIMMLCGQYDGSGDFAYRVGLPAKSGVGGGILAIAPHRASIAVWSPALDPMGNSWLGTLGLELLAQKTDWSVFGMARSDARIVADA